MALLNSVTGKIMVSPDSARALLAAAEGVPEYGATEYYSFDVQAAIYRQIRDACPGEFDRLVGQIRLGLEFAPYFVRVQGLAFDPAHRLFLAINRAFGDLVASPFNERRGQLIHHIHPSTDLSARNGKKYETEKYHTDTADWEPPVKLISMVCVRGDAHGGGKSLVLTIDSVRDELRKRAGSGVLELLERQPVPFHLADYLGGGVARRPILTGNEMCWRRYTMDHALHELDEELSPEMNAAIGWFEKVIEEAPGQHEFLMEEGELLFLDNLKTLHARTPIENEHLSERFMVRSWVQTSENN